MVPFELLAEVWSDFRFLRGRCEDGVGGAIVRKTLAIDA